MPCCSVSQSGRGRRYAAEGEQQGSEQPLPAGDRGEPDFEMGLDQPRSMVISRKSRNYQRVLYIINALSLIVGVVMISLSVWEMTKEEQSFSLPVWTVQLILAMGVIVFLFSFVGCYGAYVARAKIARRQTNWWLWCYFVVLLISLLLQLVAAGFLLVLAGVVDDARTNNVNNDVIAFEDVRSTIENNPGKWNDVQDILKCCGYNCSASSLVFNASFGGCSEGPPDFATGSYCPGNPQNLYQPYSTIPTCRQFMLDEAAEQAVLLGSMAVVFAIIQLAAFVAACCLCCVKPDN